MYPLTAQHAIREGAVVAQNLIAYIEEKMDKKEVFDYKTKGLMASIGKRTGVGNLMGIQVQGFLAWWIWRNYYLANLPNLHKKIRVLVDWIIDIFFRRDVTKLKTLAEINLQRIGSNIRKQSVCISVQIERHIEMDEKVKFLTQMDANVAPVILIN